MRKLAYHISIFSLISILLGCTDKKDLKSTFLKSHQNLSILLADPVETLDPIEILFDSDWKVASNIFEGLVSLGEDNEIVNELTDTLSISQNGLKYEFKLKQNIYFHDNACFREGKGRKLNAGDIKYMFERLSDKENNFANRHILGQSVLGINEYSSGKAESIKGIKIIDSLKLQVELIKPSSSFLLLLTAPNFYILPEEAVLYYKNEIASNPVGTGPFRISEYHEFERIILVKNENYHKKDKNEIQLPYIKSIEFTTIKKSENRLTELIKGNIHFINANKEEHRKFLENPQIAGQFELDEIDKGSGVKYWGFYFDNNAGIEYKRLRSQIADYFDLSFIVNSKNNNKYAYSLVPEYHLDKKHFEMLKRSSPRATTVNQTSDWNDTVAVMSNIVSQDLLELEKTLSSLNIPFKRIIKQAQYYSSISKIKPTLFRVSMVPAYPDPLEYYSLFYSKNSPTINLGSFSNKDYDKIYEQLSSVFNQKEKTEAYGKLEKILKEEAAALYLTHPGSKIFIYSKQIKNIKYKYTIPDFTQAYVEND